MQSFAIVFYPVKGSTLLTSLSFTTLFIQCFSHDLWWLHCFKYLLNLYASLHCTETESCSVMSDSLRTHGILQATILEWVAFPFCRGSSQLRDRIQLSHIAGGFFSSWATREAQTIYNDMYIFKIYKDGPKLHCFPVSIIVCLPSILFQYYYVICRYSIFILSVSLVQLAILLCCVLIHSVESVSLWPYGLWPTRLLCL